MILTLIISCTSVFLVAHEVTHLALYHEAEGICLGYCHGEGEKWIVGAAYGLGAEKQNEVLPNLVGLAAMSCWLLLGFYYFFEQPRKQAV